ncbi:probable G-protein coupled receptor Mth-like 3 isoform X1 [Procambarus clarkii]|uniref:probable G-protein coupled receptor Mth-like 3 isoform X1 n=1 Tax=Procambarus clarkii TaxID=6728 RepID=UPI0037421210
MMNMQVLKTVGVWMLLIGNSAPMNNIHSQLVKGQKCCRENLSQTPSGCLSQVESSFTPPLNFVNTSEAPHTEVLWTPYSLKCPRGFNIAYYNLESNVSRIRPSLIIEGERIKLKWLDEIIFKTTSNFCVEALPNDAYRALACRPDPNIICRDGTCVSNCCGQQEALNKDSYPHCLPTNIKKSTYNYKTISGNPIEAPSDEVIITIVPDCKPIIFLDSERYYLLPNGQLYEHEKSFTYGLNTYCITHNETGSMTGAFACHVPESKAETVKSNFQSVGVVLSAIFLIVTVIFHIVIPELRDMQGLCLLCHMSSLIVADLALFTSYIFSKDLTRTHCIINGVILQFSFLAVFFWLNVMCFDIWRVIRGTVHCIPITGILANDAKKFRVYSTYAWGGPVIVTVVGIIVENLPDHPTFNSLIRPGFGKVSCWYQGDIERLTHFYGIVALLFVMNLLLLGHTVFMLYQAGSAFQCCARQFNITAFNRHHLEIFWQRFTLFLLMALCWTTEILSWKIPPPELWFLTDVLNSLQGFIIFLIFISGKKKRELVRDALTGTISAVSNAARKISMSNDTAATWHQDTNSTSV